MTAVYSELPEYRSRGGRAAARRCQRLGCTRRRTARSRPRTGSLALRIGGSSRGACDQDDRRPCRGLSGVRDVLKNASVDGHGLALGARADGGNRGSRPIAWRRRSRSVRRAGSAPPRSGAPSRSRASSRIAARPRGRSRGHGRRGAATSRSRTRRVSRPAVPSPARFSGDSPTGGRSPSRRRHASRSRAGASARPVGRGPPGTLSCDQISPRSDVADDRGDRPQARQHLRGALFHGSSRSRGSRSRLAQARLDSGVGARGSSRPAGWPGPRSRPRDPRSGSAAGGRRASAAASRSLGPSSSSTAGSSTQRTTIASRNTAAARPKPNSLIARSSPSMNDRNTQIMIAAAALITRPVKAIPSATARRGVAVADPFLAHARDQEHLVVHRQAEHDREHQHRDPRLDRALGRRRAGPPASPSGRRARSRRARRRCSAGSSAPPGSGSPASGRSRTAAAPRARPRSR